MSHGGLIRKEDAKQLLLHDTVSDDSEDGEKEGEGAGEEEGEREEEEDTEDSFSHKCCAWVRDNCKKIMVTAFLWMAYTLCSMAYSTINPFFPQIVSSQTLHVASLVHTLIIEQAQSKGASHALIGLVISASPFVAVVLSPVLGYFVSIAVPICMKH